MLSLLTNLLVIALRDIPHLFATMGSNAVTPFPGVFNSSTTPAGLPWDTYSKSFLFRYSLGSSRHQYGMVGLLT